MADRLPPHAIELVADSLLKSFHRKRALRDFLRRSGVAAALLADWNEEERKRDFIYRLFPALEQSEPGANVIKQIAANLAEQTSFPDLEGWEDSKLKRDQATVAVKALKGYLTSERDAVADARTQVEARKRAAELRDQARRRQADLETLSSQLNALATRLGAQEAGYEFQDWFYELVGHFEVVHRKPYVAGGRQIDGSMTIDGTTYLVELKFSAGQSTGPDVDSLHKKVHDKADNTMGILISISGFSAPAIDGASGPRTMLLLLDASHLYRILGGAVSLPELVNRLRRHASQTGCAYLPAAEL